MLRNRLANALGRSVQIAVLVCDHAQEMEAVRVVRCNRQNLAVDRFGFGDATCQVVLESFRDFGVTGRQTEAL